MSRPAPAPGGASMHAEPPAGFPVSVNTWRWKLDAREVEVALTTFGDAWLLVLTETGTFGTILLATCVLACSRERAQRACLLPAAAQCRSWSHYFAAFVCHVIKHRSQRNAHSHISPRKAATALPQVEGE